MLRSSLSSLLSNGARRALPLLSPLSSLQSSRLSSRTLNPPNPKENGADESLQDSKASISIDRSGLYNPPDHFHEPSSDSEMVKHLKSIIKFRGGPISVAEYMEEVLTNPKSGFYINRDVFGNEGDFITSPEVSQMFGEMVGVWTMCLWEQMGRPERINLVELGPGRGTLMADLLRSSSKFVNFTKSLNIHMVECSPTLQKLQYKTLECVDEVVSDEDNSRTVSMLSSVPISWHATMEEYPPSSLHTNSMMLYLCINFRKHHVAGARR